MKISVIGSGVYGKAIANVLSKSDGIVTMWTEKDPKEITVPLERVNVTNSYELAATGAEILFILTGSKFVSDVLKGLKPFIDPNAIIVLGSKGIGEDGSLMTDYVREILPDNPYAVISGPTFAVDIAAGEPVGFTIATKERSTFDKISSALIGTYLEYSSDTEAIEMAGSLKNAYAIGSGMLSGLNYGNSTLCLYITRVLREIGTIYSTLGYNEYSTLTLAGVGDLVLTSTSPNSRNFTFGTILAIGRQEEKASYLKTNTVEGYENLKSYVKLFSKKNVETPILKCVFDVVEGNAEASSLIDLLLKK